MAHINTIGELKEFLKEIPDDIPISVYTEGMEQRGYLLGGININLKNTEIIDKKTYDAFDGIKYTYKAYDINYVEDNGDVKVLIID